MSSREQGQAMPSIVAVVSVVAIVVALVAFFAGGEDPAAAPRAQTGTSEAPSPTASAEPQAPQTAAQAPVRERADRDDRTAPDKKQRRAEQRQQRRQRTSPDSGAPDVYVEVYNNTSISGLAAQRAAELQDAGWQVVGVDNWFGDIPASTVYYPAGFEAEADALAEALGIGRVRGAVAPMKFDRLTVILTADAA